MISTVLPLFAESIPLPGWFATFQRQSYSSWMKMVTQSKAVTSHQRFYQLLLVVWWLWKTTRAKPSGRRNKEGWPKGKCKSSIFTASLFP